MTLDQDSCRTDQKAQTSCHVMLTGNISGLVGFSRRLSLWWAKWHSDSFRLRYFVFDPASVIPPIRHTHISFLYQRRNTVFKCLSDITRVHTFSKNVAANFGRQKENMKQLPYRGPQTLNATMQNVFNMAKWRMEFVHP